MGANKNVDKVWDLIEEKNICMLVTRDDGVMRARPMAASPRRSEHTIWFITDRRNHKDEEIRTHPEVCMTFQDERGNNYVSVSGTARMVEDRAKLEKLWNPAVDAWFEGGPDDPRATLIAVEPLQAEFWDNTSSDVLVMLKMARASLIGGRPDLGDNAKVGL